MTGQPRTRPRLPGGKSGPIRWGAHLLVASGRLPTLSSTRDLIHGLSGPPRARAVRVFAVEPTSIQVDWSALGPGPVVIRAADTEVHLDATGGPGAALLDGLPSGKPVSILFSGPGVPAGAITLRAQTPLAPPGEELLRVATVSDLHIGETTFGYLHTIGEPASTPTEQAHPLRCARIAIDDAAAWGAEHLIVKGDLVDQSHPGHWHDAIQLLEAAPMPVHVIPGNHETKSRRTIDAVDALAGTSIDFTESVSYFDFRDVRVVLANTAVEGEERGRLSAFHKELLAALADVPGGAFVAMHHHLRRNHAPSGWPVGVPVGEARRTLDEIVATHPHTMLTSGHVHRNRLWRYGPLVLTCVGSVKDYPGVWGGYAFHEGGVRQVVRRVADPSAMAWTERTGDALAGFYRHWTPGRLDQRCVTIPWT